MYQEIDITVIRVAMMDVEIQRLSFSFVIELAYLFIVQFSPKTDRISVAYSEVFTCYIQDSNVSDKQT